MEILKREDTLTQCMNIQFLALLIFGQKRITKQIRGFILREKKLQTFPVDAFKNMAVFYSYFFWTMLLLVELKLRM